MSETDFQGYQQRIADFLASDRIKPFSCEETAAKQLDANLLRLIQYGDSSRKPLPALQSLDKAIVGNLAVSLHDLYSRIQR